MRRLATSLTAFSLLLAPAFADAAASTPRGFASYEHAREGIRFAYPARWTVTASDDAMLSARTVALFTGPSQRRGSITANIVVEDLQEDMSLSAYTEATMASLRAAFPRLRVASSAAATVDGSPTHALAFTLRAGGTALTLRQLWTLKNGKAYILTFSAPTVVFRRNERVFRAMAGTLQID